MPLGMQSAANYTTHGSDFVAASRGAKWKDSVAQDALGTGVHRLLMLPLPMEESLGGCRNLFREWPQGS